MNQPLETIDWGKHIGNKVDFLRPGYLEKKWRQGRIIRLSEKSDPLYCVIVVGEDGKEYAIDVNIALSFIILLT